MPWLSSTGTLMLMVSGLVVWLDIAGPRQVEAWARRAKERQDDTEERRSNLRESREDEDRARRIAKWAASARPGTVTDAARPPDLEGLDWLTVEDLQTFRWKTWDSIKNDPRYPPITWGDKLSTFPYFEKRAYRFLAERLPDPRGPALNRTQEDIENRITRWEPTRLALWAALLPGAAVLSWLFHLSGAPWGVSILGAYLMAGTMSLGSAAALATPRFVIALPRAAATVRLSLAKTAKNAIGIGEIARPLRVIAFVLFVVGSLLGLIGNWS